MVCDLDHHKALINKEKRRQSYPRCQGQESKGGLSPPCASPLHLGRGGRWTEALLPSVQEAGRSRPAHCTVFPELVLCLAVTAGAGRSWGGGAEAAHSGYQGDAAEPALLWPPGLRPKASCGGRGRDALIDYPGLGLWAAPLLFPLQNGFPHNGPGSIREECRIRAGIGLHALQPHRTGCFQPLQPHPPAPSGSPQLALEQELGLGARSGISPHLPPLLGNEECKNPPSRAPVRLKWDRMLEEQQVLGERLPLPDRAAKLGLGGRGSGWKKSPS